MTALPPPVGAVVSAHLAPGDISSKSFAGLTQASPVAVRQLGDGTWQVEFDGPLTPDEQWAVRNRLLSSTAAEEDLRTRLADADLSALDPTVAAVLADLIKLANGESD